ncbi:uncharacterized protein CC84DRAFT_1203551 [Paraphaeosphaeria sporulosa]|uniref:Uncharacterized protein n=1 Tax=Paraphaeosphaeria sporulosa TaxID=1460663 RepID=A0A177CMG1_9PLEO|nr:uncharacterized protein CC84DRAFT_1203551 [Paraphaeosphaeria sporulosa]OAG08068.1 hypothetical protein CC84DRAFT_1203551 [Paraphaeosphaeria sporulosa]
MFGNLFNHVVPVPAARPESSVPSLNPAEPRYPKRKRAEVHYDYEDAENTDDDSELEYTMPVKRARTTKPPPKHKIFPFMALPAELRNRIYEECLPSPTKLPDSYEGNREGIWLSFTQRSYKKTVAYVPSLDETELENVQFGIGFVARATRRGTGRGRGRGQASSLPSNAHDDSESQNEEPQTGPKTFGFNILSVCKQIYDEAAPMMYARPLVFTDVDGLFGFAAKLSPRTAKLIRSIEIRCWTPTRSRKSQGYNSIAMLAAKGVTSLTSLFINCSMGYFINRSYYGYYAGLGRKQRKDTPTPKRIARKVYRDCHLWLEAMGAVHGDFYKGVEVLQLSGEMFLRGGGTWAEVGKEDKAIYKKELQRLLREGA